jgi:hypothetical protein
MMGNQGEQNMTPLEEARYRVEVEEYRRNSGSMWDRMSTPTKWSVGIGMAVYFGGGLIVPFFWRL